MIPSSSSSSAHCHHTINGANGSHARPKSKQQESDVAKDEPQHDSRISNENGNNANGHDHSTASTSTHSAAAAAPAQSSITSRPDATALTRHPSLKILRNTPKGRAVHATAHIPARTIIDVTPVLVFEPEEYERFVGKSRVWFYSFTWPGRVPVVGRGEAEGLARDLGRESGRDEGDMEGLGEGHGHGNVDVDGDGAMNADGQSRASKSVKQTQAMPLGLGALFNHASVSSWGHNVGFIRYVEEEVIRYVTLRDVEEGEELCICYGDERRLGFANADGRQKEIGEEDDGDGFGGFARVGDVFE